MDIKDFVNVRTIESVTNDLVERIIDRRKALKITQKALSTRSGVSYASIRKFERTGEVSFRSLLLISNALDFLVDFDKVCTTIAITNLKEYEPNDK